MARLRFYGSLVTISIRIRPTFCRTFRFGFLLCSNASGVLQAHAYIPFPIFSALSSSTYETEPPTRLEAVRITFHLSFFQNSFPNVDLMDFLEADPSGVPKPGHRTHGVTSRMVCAIRLAPPCPSINAVSLHS